MSPPLAIDLYCGLGGWAEGFLSEGYDVIGFDIEYRPYPGQLVLQDVLTLHGSRFRDASVIVASPPCQGYSYRAMPWKRAKALPPPDNSLFDACFRIQREASEAAGRYIPLVVENVKGAQPWVGRAKWHYGSYYLWGDVPALMPPTSGRRAMKAGVTHRSNGSTNFYGVKAGWDNTTRGKLRRADGVKVPDHTLNKVPGKQSVGFNVMAVRQMKESVKNNGNGTWFGKSHGVEYPPDQSGNPVNAGVKVGGEWFGSYAEQKAAGTISPGRMHGSGSNARKQASALIAKIPFPLAQHIARTFKP